MTAKKKAVVTDLYAAGYAEARRQDIAACEEYAETVGAHLMDPTFVAHWRKALDGKTLANTRSAAAKDCASAIRKLTPPSKE